jgi:hypothetical protein
MMGEDGQGGKCCEPKASDSQHRAGNKRIIACALMEPYPLDRVALRCACQRREGRVDEQEKHETAVSQFISYEVRRGDRRGD